MSHIAQTLSDLSETTLFNSYLSFLHAIDYTGLDDNMSDAFNDWLSEIDDDTMVDHVWQFLLEIDRRIPGGINWWSDRQIFTPKIK